MLIHIKRYYTVCQNTFIEGNCINVSSLVHSFNDWLTSTLYFPEECLKTGQENLNAIIKNDATRNFLPRVLQDIGRTDLKEEVSQYLCQARG